MKRMLIEGPAAEPVLVAEAKAHLRVDGDAEDDLIGALIAAARVAVETEIRRVLIAQSWRAFVETWPADGVILPVAPAMAVDEVRAIDAAGVTIVLEAEEYEFDPADGSVVIDPVAAAVRYEIDFTAGYGTSGIDVPQPLRQAVRLLVTHWYENRSAVILGDNPAAMPLGFGELVAPYRRMALC
jgi:uncharacterized phiE125 gp8 family phage protein